MGSLARVIIGLKPKKGIDESDHEHMEEDDDGEMMPDDGDMGYEVHAEDLLQAISDKDPTALAEALKSFIEYCK